MAQNEPTVWFSSQEVKAKLQEAKFKPFTDEDWQAFAGCESDEPWIFYSYAPGTNYLVGMTVILDGTHVEAYYEAEYSYLPSWVMMDFESLTDAVDFAILMTKSKSWAICSN